MVGLAETAAPLVELNPGEGVHEQVAAPIAVKTIEFPEQIVDPIGELLKEAEIEIVGSSLTETTIFFVAEQLPDIPVTVQLIVAVGCATTIALEVKFSAVDGNHVYLEALPAEKVVELPKQIVAEDGTTETVGTVTVTTIDFLDMQPPESPSTE